MQGASPGGSHDVQGIQSSLALTGNQRVDLVGFHKQVPVVGRVLEALVEIDVDTMPAGRVKNVKLCIKTRGWLSSSLLVPCTALRGTR